MEWELGEFGGRSVDRSEILLFSGAVEGHIELPETDLPQVGQAHVEVAGNDQLLHEVVGNRLAGLVMTGEPCQHSGIPAPVLHDL